MRGPLYSMILERGAHHYDLRGAHPKDTDEVQTCTDISRLKGGILGEKDSRIRANENSRLD